MKAQNLELARYVGKEGLLTGTEPGEVGRDTRVGLRAGRRIANPYRRASYRVLSSE